jgi:excisionase family DNA binding protein
VLETDTIYTVDEVAAHFKVSRTTVERAIRSGRLRAYIFGDKSLRVPESALDALLNTTEAQK